MPTKQTIKQKTLALERTKARFANSKNTTEFKKNFILDHTFSHPIQLETDQ